LAEDRLEGRRISNLPIGKSDAMIASAAGRVNG
jgi:hypothetical protein